MRIPKTLSYVHENFVSQYPGHKICSPQHERHQQQRRQAQSAPTLTADMTTAELACCRRGVTLSMIPSASRPSAGTYLASESKMNTYFSP